MKHSHVDLDVDVEDKEIIKKGKKKTTTIGEKAEKIVEELGNFMAGEDIEVTQEAEDTAKTIDLCEEMVAALTAVDFEMVPFLENKVSCRDLWIVF